MLVPLLQTHRLPSLRFLICKLRTKILCRTFFQAARKMADIQTGHAYQTQPVIFQNKKRVLLRETGKEKVPQYNKNIGLVFNTPKEAWGALTWRRNALSFPMVPSPSKRGACSVAKVKMQRTSGITEMTSTTQKHQLLHTIRICPCTFPPALGMSRSSTLSQWVNAGLWARLCFNMEVAKAAGTKMQLQKF